MRKDVALRYTRSEEQMADIDTKALKRQAFEKHRAGLGLIDADDPRVRRIIASAKEIERKHRAAYTSEALEVHYAKYFDDAELCVE